MTWKLINAKTGQVVFTSPSKQACLAEGRKLVVGLKSHHEARAKAIQRKIESLGESDLARGQLTQELTREKRLVAYPAAFYVENDHDLHCEVVS